MKHVCALVAFTGCHPGCPGLAPKPLRARKCSSSPRASRTGSSRAWTPRRRHHSSTKKPRNPRSWQQGAFWVGMTRLADVSGEKRFREAILAMGRAKQWKPGPRLYHADDHVIAQSYLWAARHGAGAEAIAPLRASFDAILARPAIAHLSFYSAKDYEDDRLPAPLVLVRCLVHVAAGLGGPRRSRPAIRATRISRWRNSGPRTDFLYDPVEKLYFRDSRFFERRDDQGRKLFWSRGNGWVFAGIANLLDALPKDSPHRPRMEGLFREMAAKLKAHPEARRLLGAFLVRPGKLAARDQRHRLLRLRTRLGREERPARRARSIGRRSTMAGRHCRARWRRTAGWAGCSRSVTGPRSVAEADTQFYGVGAFLLAASAVASIAEK